MQTFGPNSIPAMLKDTIDPDKSVPLSFVLAIAEVTGSVQNKTCLSHYLAHFSTDQGDI